MKVMVFQRPKGALAFSVAARRPTAQGRHVVLGPGLVDEDQAGGIDPPLILAPLLAATRDVRPVLLLGEQAFF
jgi:hypothetical protein